MDSNVSIVRCSDYEEKIVEDSIRRSLELIGGLEQVVSAGNRVLLKVNLLSPTEPDLAVTTHPVIVKAVVKLVRETGGVPFIADAPGYMFAGGKGRALRKSGISEIAEELDVEACQFEGVEKPFINTHVEDAVWLNEIMAARLALEADVIINLPKLKTHSNTWYTGAIKNMFGAVAASTRKEAHNLGELEKFAGAVLDIYSTMVPHLAVMDAIIGMEGEGPRHGKPRHTGLILASRDSVALDAVASRIIGFEPDEILMVRQAVSRGLGDGDLGNIEVKGEQIADVSIDYDKPSGRQVNIHPLMMRLGSRLIKVQPRLRKDICTECKICAESCPADAITMNPYPDIDRSICVECFCCNEMCPEGAMEVRKNWLARMIGRGKD